jgi:hypothetical protein
MLKPSHIRTYIFFLEFQSRAQYNFIEELSDNINTRTVPMTTSEICAVLLHGVVFNIADINFIRLCGCSELSKHL